MIKTETMENLKQHIKQMLSKAAAQFGSRPFNYKQLAAAAGLSKQIDKKLIEQAVSELERSGAIEKHGRAKYVNVVKSNYVVGIIDRNSNGKSHIIPEDGSDKIFVAERNLKRAIKGDTVGAVIYASRSGRQREGEVVEIIKRARETFVGVLSIHNNVAFVVVDNRILTNDIYVPMDKLDGAKDGQKVFVKIVSWPANVKNPIGEIIEVLGDAGSNDTEMHAILMEYGLPFSYPEDIAAYADTIDVSISKEEIASRRDCRDIPTFTIDPKDAKDFDDAVSCRRLENGNFEVGVHIADVSYYVKPGDPIDKEAYDRATSVYLVDRTVPMLPEKLCNMVCSLRPDEEKLCYSVLFEMNEEAQVLKSAILRTVIKSDRRFTYDEAQEVIETGEGDMKEEILILDKLAKKLRKDRFKNGAIAFERSEVKFELDSNGKPVDVYFKESKDANKLIEEFMLLANRTVAEHIGKLHDKTFVYRVHDEPDQTKLANLAQFIKQFGYKLKASGKRREVSSSINRLLDSVDGKREQNLIETVAIRSMAKAIYSTDNIGHYGLSFDYYTHFTSPIRRYPDMMVHRLLALYDQGGKSVSKAEYEEYCKHCSAQEQLAASAERASVKYKQVEYMGDKKGQVFAGVISGVTEWGLYVEISCNKCEGMVSLRDLDDDYYVYDEKNYCIVGKHSKRRYCLGDEVNIMVSKVNLDKKQMDFVIVNP